MTPDARPDVTALDWRVDGNFVHVRYVVKEDGVASSSFFNVHSPQNAAAIVKHHNVFVADLARRLTEQEAEIARLREQKDVIARDRDSCMVDFGALSKQRDEWKYAATAAEQALTAARRERPQM